MPDGDLTSGLAVPRIVVSAPWKSSGKTMVSLGMTAALCQRGLRVAPFKKGPDFIDPMWLTAAAGRACRNLDFFIMGESGVYRSFVDHVHDADIALIEGNLGLFDGQDLVHGSDCTAALAAVLGAPVVLVVNCRGLARSLAPLLMGQLAFPGGGQIAGIILNNVASSRQENRLLRVVQQHCAVPVLGVVPRADGMMVDERHLGLVPVAEQEASGNHVAHIASQVAAHVDLDRVLELARSAGPLPPPPPEPHAPVLVVDLVPDVRTTPLTVAYAAGAAFHFYYPDNLEALRRQGVRFVPFDPLRDDRFPEVQGLYIGGGFPEMFMDALFARNEILQQMHHAIMAGLPTYAECGGLMLLAERLYWQSRHVPLCGVLPIEVEMKEKPQGYGYMEIESTGVLPWPPLGSRVRCHEFHYSRVRALSDDVRYAYRVRRGSGVDGVHDGLVYRKVLASYAHIHAVGAPGWANFLARFWGLE